MININLTFPELDKIFEQHEKEIMGVMAASMQTNRAMMFDKDGADNGKPKWADLKFRRGRPLQKTGALRNSFAPTNDGISPAHAPDGILEFVGDKVTIGTRLGYARLMNDGTGKMPGGVLVPVNAQALKIPITAGMIKEEVLEQQRKAYRSRDVIPKRKEAMKKAGIISTKEGKFMFRRSVKIPARPMDIITEADETEFSETLANYISEVLSAG